MCRLLGVASPWTVSTSDVIGAANCTAFQQMGRLHHDGWGTAWIDERGGVQHERVVTPATNNPQLAKDLTSSPSRARITHLRLATDGMRVGVENTHPFQVGDIAFAHNGSIRPFGDFAPLVSESEVARVGSGTDTARMFALVLRAIDDGATLFDAVCDVTSRLRSEFPTSAINLLVLSPRELIAVHSNEGAAIPYDDFARSGLGDDLPADHLDHYYRMSTLRQLDGTVAFSSSGLDRDGWDPMGQHTAARVDLGTMDFSLRALD